MKRDPIDDPSSEDYIGSWNGTRTTPQDILARATWWVFGIGLACATLAGIAQTLGRG